MALSDLQPTSAEVQGLLALATKGKSKTAQLLAKTAREKFDILMDTIEQNPDTTIFVLDHHYKSKLSGVEIQKFRKSVLSAIEKPAKNSKEQELDMGDGEDFGSPELAKLALSIRKLYSSTWYANKEVGDFSVASQEYLDAFLKFYGNEGDLSDKGGRVKTKNKKSGKNKKEEKWKESEDDGYDGFLKPGDMVIVKTIFTMLQSYLDALLRKMGSPTTAENTKIVLNRRLIIDDGMLLQR